MQENIPYMDATRWGSYQYTSRVITPLIGVNKNPVKPVYFLPYTTGPQKSILNYSRGAILYGEVFFYLRSQVAKYLEDHPT